MRKPRSTAYSSPHVFLTMQVSMQLGITKRTLERMIRSGVVTAPLKAENGYYYWTARDIETARQALERRAAA